MVWCGVMCCGVVWRVVVWCGVVLCGVVWSGVERREEVAGGGRGGRRRKNSGAHHLKTRTPEYRQALAARKRRQSSVTLTEFVENI